MLNLHYASSSSAGVEVVVKPQFERSKECCVDLGARMKLRVVCRKIYNYVRYDLKEIAFPSSLPDPPHIKKRLKLTWKERYLVLKEASRLYCASWVRDIGPELRPNDYKKAESEDESNGEKCTTKEKEPSTLEDLAVAARGGMETLKLALQRVYMTRASAYRDALKSFIEGYQEGIQQVMEKKKDSKSQSEADPPKT
ncbi:embryo defective 2735 [Perilla frutescens var. hirtella]|nr:embryo defective 2735 [Perilla frutescens var. hirtella]